MRPERVAKAADAHGLRQEKGRRRQVFYCCRATGSSKISQDATAADLFLMPDMLLARLFIVYLVPAYVFILINLVSLFWVSCGQLRVCVFSISHEFDVGCQCPLFEEREEQRGDAHTILAKHPAGEVFWSLLGVLISQCEPYLTELM